MLHEHASARTLGFARVWIFGMCLGDVVREPTWQLAGMPLEYVLRVGPLALLPDGLLAALYSATFLAVFKVVLALSLAACVLGLRPFRAIAVVTCVGLTLHHALVRSVGHVNHGELVMLYGAYVLAAFPSADALAIGRRPMRERPPAVYAAPLVLIAFVFCLSYCFVGSYRLATGGPQVFVDGSGLRLVLAAASRPGAYGSHAAGLDLLADPAAQSVLLAGYVFVTAMEVLSPLALFSTRFRGVWCLAMIGFHLAAWQLMQILFFHNLVLMPLLMLDVEYWLARLSGLVRAAPTTF